MSLPIERTHSLKVSRFDRCGRERAVAEEMPVALVYDGSTRAVMMASPIDLADFAYGFSLTEGIISDRGDILSLEIVEHDSGIELRMWLAPDRSRAQAERRRMMIGPTGCGLCGVESLQQALKELRPVSPRGHVAAQHVREAVDGLRPLQVLNQQTGAMHGAAFWQPGFGIRVIREDVGRHNALDKLVGALHRDGIASADGIVVLTSRVSVEMVQKAAAIGATIVAAISAPTALAIRTAEAAGITLVAVARHDAFEVFSHCERVVDCAGSLSNEHNIRAD